MSHAPELLIADQAAFDQLITTLEQEEALAWLPDGKGFLYDTEKVFPTRDARIFKVSCVN